MQDKIILIEKDIQAVKDNHAGLIKSLQESLTLIEKLTIEKEKTSQLLAIKAGEFQALNRVLEVLKTEESKVELDSVGN
jgi:hypothetical protein